MSNKNPVDPAAVRGELEHARLARRQRLAGAGIRRDGEVRIIIKEQVKRVRRVGDAPVMDREVLGGAGDCPKVVEVGLRAVFVWVWGLNQGSPGRGRRAGGAASGSVEGDVSAGSWPCGVRGQRGRSGRLWWGHTGR